MEENHARDGREKKEGNASRTEWLWETRRVIPKGFLATLEEISYYFC